MSHAEPSPVLPLEHDDRAEFQLERLILFSDAVFAIAITLLVLEIHLPELPEHATNQDLRAALAHIAPKFLSYTIGFVIIAIFWVFHHRLFRYVRHYDARLIILNFLYLFAIAIMPFTVGIYGEHPSLSWGLTLYGSSVALAGVALTLLTAYIRNPRNHIAASHHHGHPELDLGRPLIMTSAFTVVAVAAIFMPTLHAQWLMVGLVLPIRLWNRFRVRKLKAAHEARMRPLASAPEAKAEVPDKVEKPAQ